MNAMMKKVLVTLGVLWPLAVSAAEATTTLVIHGMHCALCAPAITKALKRVDGVKTVEVSVADERAVVVADESVTAEALIAAVGTVGFAATVTKGK